MSAPTNPSDDRWWLGPTLLGLVGLPALWVTGMKLQGPRVQVDIENRTKSALDGQYPNLTFDVDGRDVAIWGQLPTEADGRHAASLVSSLHGVNQVKMRYWTPPPAVGHAVEITALPGGYTVAAGALPTGEARSVLSAAARHRATATIESGLTVSTSVTTVDPAALDGFADLVRVLPRTATDPVTVRWDSGGIRLTGAVDDPAQRAVMIQAAEAIGLPFTDELIVRRRQEPERPPVEATSVATAPEFTPVEVVRTPDGRAQLRGTVADGASHAALVFFVGAIVDPSLLDDAITVDPRSESVSIDEAIELANRQRPAAPDDAGYAAAVASIAPITFDTGDVALDDEQLNRLLDVAEVIRNAPSGTKVVVVGHSDRVGGEDYNVLISQQRAEVVRLALVFAGVPESMLAGRAAGSSEPVLEERTWSDRQANRRVSFSVVSAG